MEQKKGEHFSIRIQKKNPKKNQQSYKLETVQQIFDILTENNIDRFMREFKRGMKIGIETRKMIYELDKENKLPYADLKLSSFTWIDD